MEEPVADHVISHWQFYIIFQGKCIGYPFADYAISN
jgi:hypothetical protein